MYHMENMDLIEETKSQLKRLKLSQSWAAGQIGKTYNHFNRVMGRREKLSDDMKSALVELNDMLKSFPGSKAV